MGIELISKTGKSIGFLSDSNSSEDFVIVNEKRVKLSEVYANKELRDSFNNEIKSLSLEDTNDTND